MVEIREWEDEFDTNDGIRYVWEDRIEKPSKRKTVKIGEGREYIRLFSQNEERGIIITLPTKVKTHVFADDCVIQSHTVFQPRFYERCIIPWYKIKLNLLFDTERIESINGLENLANDKNLTIGEIRIAIWSDEKLLLSVMIGVGIAILATVVICCKCSNSYGILRDRLRHPRRYRPTTTL